MSVATLYDRLDTREIARLRWTPSRTVEETESAAAHPAVCLRLLPQDARELVRFGEHRPVAGAQLDECPFRPSELFEHRVAAFDHLSDLL